MLAFVTALDFAVEYFDSANLTYLGAFVAAALISTGRCAAWVVVGHHAMHGGYTSLAKKGLVASRYKRGTFAIGLWRRCIDWVDWMMPEAWNLEHNKLHHYQVTDHHVLGCASCSLGNVEVACGPCRGGLAWLQTMALYLTGAQTFYTITQLSEESDPDCVERNFAKHRNLSVPLWVKWFPMPVFLVGWKYIYYSTNCKGPSRPLTCRVLSRIVLSSLI